MGRFGDLPLPTRLEQSYQGFRLKLAISWYGSSLSLALRSESKFVLADLKASHVQSAGRTMRPKGGTGKMKKDVVIKSMLAAAGILVAASMAFAKFPLFDLGRSSKKSADVELFETGRIPGGPTLQSGEYRVVLNNNATTPEVAFYQDGKLLAQVPAKLVDQAKKIDQTEIFYDTHGHNTPVITEMDLGGWREKVFFGQSSGSTSSTK
jgi:hypothetical protein